MDALSRGEWKNEPNRVVRSGWMDALSRGDWMDALSRDGWKDTLCRSGWMDALSRGWLDGYVK